MVKVIAYQSKEYTQLLELRNQVLRIPLGMDIKNDLLEEEVNDIHIGYFEKDKVLGTLILRDIGSQTYKMRQVAVSENSQGKGIGKKIALFAEELAKENHFKKIELSGRIEAVSFYEKLNYKTVGPSFLEIGILHFKMIKTL